MKTVNEMKRVSDLLLSQTAKLSDSEWCDIIEPILEEDYPALVSWVERAYPYIERMKYLVGGPDLEKLLSEVEQ